MKLTPEKAESSNGIFLMNFNMVFLYFIHTYSDLRWSEIVCIVDKMNKVLLCFP